MAEKDVLLQTIERLEAELRERDQHLADLRTRMLTMNHNLEGVIGELRAELGIVAELQKLLCPTEMPHLQGVDLSSRFLAGTDSGGDYLDVFEMEDRFRFGIVMSACSGYGASALFLSVLIQLASRAESKRMLDPHLVIEQMDQKVRAKLSPRDHASLFYAILDRRKLELRYSGCGDVTAWILRNGAPRPTRLVHEAKSISVASGAQQFLSNSISLDAGDRFVLCSAGIHQCRNAQGEEWGLASLSSLLGAAEGMGVHALRNEILYRAEQHSGTKDPRRDQTVLVAEVQEKVIQLAKKDSP